MFRIFFALLTTVSLAYAQQPSMPVLETPKPRVELVMPIGFEKVTVGGVTAICLPADAVWVKPALEALKPTSRPTVLLNDVLKRLEDNRAALVKQIQSDLAMPDDKAAQAFLTDKLSPALKKLDEVKAPVFFLVCTSNQLRDLTKSGWGEPRFHYNRFANAAAYDLQFDVVLDRPMDDVVLPAFFDEKAKPEERTKNLSAALQQFNLNIAGSLAGKAAPIVFTEFGKFISENYVEPLKLKRDQLWLGMGINVVLSSKYASVVTGIGRERWLQEVLQEQPNFPVSAAQIDLIRPQEVANMKPIAVPYYNLAMQRKATAVVLKWIETGGEKVVPDTLKALREKPAADGAELAKVIQQATGVDLLKFLAPW